MTLLQDPQKAVEQVAWYLDHPGSDKFPGASELAAGNLCRQTLEQILFILCFFSGMPKNRYFKADRTIRTAGQLICELERIDPPTGQTYWDLARSRGQRIRKFARSRSLLKKWQKQLNEPSHFSAKFRSVDSRNLKSFVKSVSGWFDEWDKYLIVAATNELLSNGRFRAVLSPEGSPGVCQKIVVGAGNLDRDEGGHLVLNAPTGGILILSDSEIPRGSWPRKLVLVQHCVGMTLDARLVTKRGDPVDLSNFQATLQSMGRTSAQRGALTRRLRKLGFTIEWEMAKK